MKKCEMHYNDVFAKAADPRDGRMIHDMYVRSRQGNQ
jgi:hypothetical protein